MEAGEEDAQAELANREEASKLDLAITSQASYLAVTKVVSDMQSNPEMVLDVNKLKLHHAIGKEGTGHLRDKSSGLQLYANPGAYTRVKWFWLLRGWNKPANHNIMLMRGDSPHAMIYFEEVCKRLDIEKALWIVFSADAIKLYDFLAREAESHEGVNRERVYTFSMDFVMSRCMKEAKSGGNMANCSATGSKLSQSNCTRSH